MRKNFGCPNENTGAREGFERLVRIFCLYGGLIPKLAMKIDNRVWQKRQQNLPLSRSNSLETDRKKCGRFQNFDCLKYFPLTLRIVKYKGWIRPAIYELKFIFNSRICLQNYQTVNPSTNSFSLCAVLFLSNPHCIQIFLDIQSIVIWISTWLYASSIGIFIGVQHKKTHFYIGLIMASEYKSYFRFHRLNAAMWRIFLLWKLIQNLQVIRYKSKMVYLFM